MSLFLNLKLIKIFLLNLKFLVSYWKNLFKWERKFTNLNLKSSLIFHNTNFHVQFNFWTIIKFYQKYAWFLIFMHYFTYFSLNFINLVPKFSFFVSTLIPHGKIFKNIRKSCVRKSRAIDFPMTFASCVVTLIESVFAGKMSSVYI